MNDAPPPVSDLIEIILTGTSHPGNLGAVARAMKNMGLHRLTLAGARTAINDEALATAKHAADVLHQARHAADLPTALANARWVFATTARPRAIHLPVLSARAAAAQIQALTSDTRTPVALVFGAERTGLTNEDLSWCHTIIEIPAHPAYPVLNLAQAVQILAYELWLARAEVESPRATAATEPPATLHEWQGFEQRLTRLLDQAGFFQRNGEDPALTRERLTEKLRIACHRAGWSDTELALMHGVLTAIARPIAPPASRATSRSTDTP